MKARLIGLGLAAFLVALLVVLPAQWVAGLLPPNLHCAAWSGSVWRGECAGLSVQQPGQPPLQVEVLQWKLQPLALLRQTVQATFQFRTAQGTGSGQVEAGRDNRIFLQDLTFTAVFDQRLYTTLAPGWTGRLQGRRLAIRVQGNTLQALSGELALHDFNDGRGGAFGSYQLVFPPDAEPPFVGALKDVAGPLETTATLTISADRQWVLHGQVKPRDGAPAGLLRSLQFFGGPDASGRYRLSVEGSFK